MLKTIGRQGKRDRVAGLLRNRAVEEFEASGVVVGPRRVDFLERPQIEIVGIETLGPLSSRSIDLGPLYFGLDHRHHALGDAVLHVEHVFDGSVEIVGPEMSPVRAVEKLGGDA